ncbi:MAG: hypothetical protein J0L75_06080 [Spirochaetes bacterium]|nr:hypothetical protein [Spirochaetota bacterium]
MKKTLVLLLLAGALSVPALAKAPAQGSTVLGAIGLNYSFFSLYTDGLGLTGLVGHKNHPFQVNLHWSFANYFGASVDWLFWRGQITQTPFWYYIGVGAGIGLGGGFNLGARVPLALQWFPVSQIEVYLEWAPGVQIIRTLGFDHALAIGARWHFGK